MEEHRHALKSLSVNETRCSCGAELCPKFHPREGTSCTLEKGHEGPHYNQWKPELGTWEE